MSTDQNRKSKSSPSSPAISGNESLGRRYLYKLMTNLLGLGISLGSQAIIPRGLGLTAYGDFNFLNSSFTQFIAFFDMGASTALFTKIAHRPTETEMVSFFSSYVAGVGIVATLILLCVSVLGYLPVLLPEQKYPYILLAMVLVVINWIVQIMMGMADALGHTIPTEKIRMMSRIVSLGVFAGFFWGGLLDLTSFFVVNLVIALALVLAMIIMFRKRGFPAIAWIPSGLSSFHRYWPEYWSYCKPLFLYALLGMTTNLFDRWFLQKCGGSEQQGYFGLSSSIGALCFMFTSAMVPLLIREFSIAFHNQDRIRMRFLFRRYVPLLYSIAAYFSCFIIIRANDIITLFGGKGFSQAFWPVAIMAIYPLYQTYGQLTGAVYYASGATGEYQRIGTIVMILGLPMTYLLIASPENWGFGAGAAGLAIKTVLIQVIGINAMLLSLSRVMGFSFGKFLAHQVFMPVCLVGFACLASRLAFFLPMIGERLLMRFIFSGIFYSGMVFCFLFVIPRAFGLEKNDLRTVARLWRGIMHE